MSGVSGSSRAFDQEHGATFDRRRFVAGVGRLAALGFVGRVAAVGALGSGSLLAAEVPAVAANQVGHRADRYPPDVIADWYRTLYHGVMDEGTGPPPAARIYAYAGVAAHEAVIGGAPHLVSLAGQLNELTPIIRSNSSALDWGLVVSASVAATMRAVLATSSPSLRTAIDDQLATHTDARRSAGLSKAAVVRSLAEGTRIGDHVGAWALRDRADQTADRIYVPPVGEDLWRSTPPNFGPAIEPYWGRTVRPFALPSADACAPPPPPAPFSIAEGSPFWQQAQVVLETFDALTDTQRHIAMFWRDNPLVSGLPAGHWMLLATQLCQERGLTLDRAAEVHAMAGLTLADAFTACWYEKYVTNLLRPVTYIRAYVPGRENWLSFVNTPQFPEYTSGHSVASQAVARVLTHVLGVFPFTDRTHATLGRNVGPLYAPRSFGSFQQAALEAAGSRLFGGIHYPMGIESGLAHGDTVADAVLARISTRRAKR
jgi:hypothetical protein